MRIIRETAVPGPDPMILQATHSKQERYSHPYSKMVTKRIFISLLPFSLSFSFEQLISAYWRGPLLLHGSCNKPNYVSTYKQVNLVC